MSDNKQETVSLGIRCPKPLNEKLEELVRLTGENKTKLILKYIEAGVEKENPQTLAADIERLKSDNEELRSQIIELQKRFESVESGKLAA